MDIRYGPFENKHARFKDLGHDPLKGLIRYSLRQFIFSSPIINIVDKSVISINDITPALIPLLNEQLSNKLVEISKTKKNFCLTKT